MTPSWYDVLDVDPDASTEQVRDAWRTAIADLDPSDRRFRLLNQAAETLLDPARRAEHDRVLAAEATEPGPPGPPGPVVDTDPAPVVQQAGPAPAPPPPAPSYAGWAPPAWLLAGLVVLLAVVVGVCLWLLRSPTDEEVAADTRAAQAAAESAAVTVLSYDYRDMQASRDAAVPLMTPSFRDDYDQLFAVLEDNAAEVQPVVTAEVVASGVEQVDEDADRVTVLVFVNRPTLNAETTTPRVTQDQVTMTMVRSQGRWLVDDLVTTDPTG